MELEEVRAVVRSEIRQALKDLSIAQMVKRCNYCFGEAFADEELIHGDDAVSGGICRRKK